MTTFPWILVLCCKAFACSMLGIVVYRALGNRSAALRHLTLTTTVVGLLLLPMLAALPPLFRVPVPISFATPELTSELARSWRESDPITTRDLVEPFSDADRSLKTSLPSSLDPSSPVGRDQTLTATSQGTIPVVIDHASVERSQGANFDLDEIAPNTPARSGSTSYWNVSQIGSSISLIWIVGALATLLIPLGGLFGIHRLRRTTAPISDSSWQPLLGDLCRELGVRQYVDLRSSSSVLSAMTWGLFRPTILLPNNARQWSQSQRRMVLLHELAHIRRFDWSIQMAASLTCSLYWFNPMIWWISRQMRVEREQACDDVVLSAGVEPAEYAAKLVQLAKQFRPRLFQAAIPMAQQSALERRVRGILEFNRRRQPAHRLVFAGTVAVCLGALFPIAMAGASHELDFHNDDPVEEELEPESTESKANPVSTPSDDNASDPIQPPLNTPSVAIPEIIQEAAAQANLKLEKVPAFHDDRNILQLSLYGDRRGLPLNSKVELLIANGGHRFWLADRFPQPKPTTIVGPFEGNAVEQFKVFDLVGKQVAASNAATYISATSGFLLSDDKQLNRIGLELIPLTMKGDIQEVGNYMHFLHRALPRRTDHFNAIGLEIETAAALESMKTRQRQIDAVTSARKVTHYETGYDSSKPLPWSEMKLPEPVWGDMVNGLRAGLLMPDTIRRNEVVRVNLVVRNVSEKTIRVTFPQQPHAYVRAVGSHLSYGMNGRNRDPIAWELAPGFQILLPLPPLQLLVPGDVGRHDALEKLTPGPHEVIASIHSLGSHWEKDANGNSQKIEPPADEWRGKLAAPTTRFTLLEKKAPYTIQPTELLPPGHGFDYQFENPFAGPGRASLRIDLMRQTEFLLNLEQDECWFRDNGDHNRTIYWGPFSPDRLDELLVLDYIQDVTSTYIREQSWFSGQQRVAALIRSAKPLAELGLRLATIVKLPQSKTPAPALVLSRAIREHRVELKSKGLEQLADEALAYLTKAAPPLPAAEKFTVVTSKTTPEDLPLNVWGPTNDGLRAAALMPKTLVAGTKTNVRIFLQNVSADEIHLTVSEKAGYEYATAIDSKGNPMRSERPYPAMTTIIFSNGLMFETNPGQSQQNPPVATLKYLLLKPGAVYELKTETSIMFLNNMAKKPDSEPAAQFPAAPQPTVIRGQPGEAQVTWRIHTANGEAFDEVSRERIWPAKGGWSSLLQTAPQKLQLK